jgi:hypothetical protein
MIIAEVRTTLPWGVLVIADERASEPVPEWSAQEDQVTATSATVVVRVRHEQEGDVTVHLCDGSGDLRGSPTWSGTVDVSSGQLILSRATGEPLLRTAVRHGQVTVGIRLDPMTEATHVDVVI